MLSISDQRLTSPRVPISWGELFDKICILEIKKVNASSGKKKKNIVAEFNLLKSFVSNEILRDYRLDMLCRELKDVNQNIWDIEDEIRSKEAICGFGKRFVELARNTYK